jgi:hypothetical protein
MGPTNYQKVAKITGEPIYDNPDLLLVPEVSARVLFAWMTDARLAGNGTLDKFTSEARFELEKAYRWHFREVTSLLHPELDFLPPEMARLTPFSMFYELGLPIVLKKLTEFNDGVMNCIQRAKVPG